MKHSQQASTDKSMKPAATLRRRRLFLFDWDNTLFPSFVYKEPPDGLWVGDVGKKQAYLTSDESIAMFSNLVDVTHLHAVNMFVGQDTRAMLSLDSNQPSSLEARAARHRAAVGAFKLLDAARNAGGEIRFVTAGTAEWLAESFDLYSTAFKDEVIRSSSDCSGGASGGTAEQYSLVLPGTVPDGSSSSKHAAETIQDTSSTTIPGFSTIHHQQDKEVVFKQLAAADSATELIIIGDGDEEMSAAATIQSNGEHAVTTIDLRERKPHNLEAFMNNLDYMTQVVGGLAPLSD